MKTKYLTLTLAGVALAAFLLLPEHLLSSTTDTFGSGEVNAKTNELKSFIFDSVIRFVALLGLAWGVLQAVLSSAFRPLLFWAVIALTVSLGGSLHDKIFPEKTMLIPDKIEQRVEWKESTLF